MLKTMLCLLLPLASFGASQGDAKSDSDLAAKIQKAIAKDNSLSAYASAVNVTVQNGVVTLKGAVRSDELSQSIQAKAESLVIQATPIERIHTVVVHNELTVSPN
jgi:hypothetical protein